MSDAERLESYVDAWEQAVGDVVALLRGLTPEEWRAPTDLAGWDVRAVAAHLAHLESELAGNEQATVEVPELPHITSLMGVYTEMGPLARADWSTDAIVEELEQSAATRLADLRATPPTDAAAAPPVTPGGIGWDWGTLLSNRPLDVWMHEQDIRRAVGRPGGLDTLAAGHTVRVFARGLPFVVGKRVAPGPGTTVVLDVTGPSPAHIAVVVDSDGRASRLQGDPDEPTVTVRLDTESYVVLAGGRRPPSDVPVEIEGDQALGARVLSSLAVTP
ncbi:MAG: maleylpyruvate isomerase family mycothiol-dependent enzyme [Nocardioides sp.]